MWAKCFLMFQEQYLQNLHYKLFTMDDEAKKTLWEKKDTNQKKNEVTTYRKNFKMFEDAT